MALDTLSDVKLSLGISGSADDSLLALLQDAADAFITAHCGRSFTGGTFIEQHAGGQRLLILQNYPVSSLIAVEVDPNRQFGSGTELDPSAFVLHADRGVIACLRGAFLPGGAGQADAFPGTVQVTYTTANTVPAAVARAYAELIGHWYRQVQSHVALGQLDQLSQFENGILIEYPQGLSEGFSLPAGVRELLQPYRTLPL
ncbi:MAG: phage head-tail connector protein [Bacteroidales bacterium]|nr:phage head-tail connector protein [Bacteroidales bacterium]